MIFLASVLAACGESAGGHSSRGASDTMVGVAAALVASALSGLGAVLTEQIMVKGRDVMLLTAELSSGGIVVVVILLLCNGDGRKVVEGTFFDSWTCFTWIPIATAALGGILVGVVTKMIGSVRKSMTITFSLLLSALCRTLIDGSLPEPPLCVAILLATAGMRKYYQWPLPPLPVLWRIAPSQNKVVFVRNNSYGALGPPSESSSVTSLSP